MTTFNGNRIRIDTDRSKSFQLSYPVFSYIVYCCHFFISYFIFKILYLTTSPDGISILQRSPSFAPKRLSPIRELSDILPFAGSAAIDVTISNSYVPLSDSTTTDTPASTLFEFFASETIDVLIICSSSNILPSVKA